MKIYTHIVPESSPQRKCAPEMEKKFTRERKKYREKTRMKDSLQIIVKINDNANDKHLFIARLRVGEKQLRRQRQMS